MPNTPAINTENEAANAVRFMLSPEFLVARTKSLKDRPAGRADCTERMVAESGMDFTPRTGGN
jgi:hypothetical protein